MNTLRAFITALMLTSSIGPSWAGAGTITTKDASGVTKTFDVITDGGGNFGSITAIGDGTALGNVAAVKAASTAAGATDPALVVAISPNNTVGATQSGTWNVTNISGTVSLPTGAATAANQATEISSLATIATNTGAAIPAGTATIGNVGVITPAGATAITASATGTTGATTATLAGTGGKTTYICWSSVRANATAATTVTDTITGVITGTLSRSLWVAPAASGIGVDEMVYNPCVPASATNTGIAVVSGAPGTGGVVTVNAGGYQL